MADNVNITVQDTINDIVVNTAVTVETIDINMQAAVDVVDIVANPNNYVVNINRIIGEQVQSDWNQSDNQAPDYIKNKPTIPSISGLATVNYVDQQDLLKVDKVAGKGLSTNDYTTAEQTKLAGIEAGAEVNVNADWDAVSGDAQILNKPTIPTATSDLTNDGADGVHPFITAADIPPPVSGLPAGGTAGQILTKVDSTDYNATWQENFADWTSVVKHTVKNNGVTTLSKGKAVYVTSSNGTNMLVGYASNDSEATSSKTMGLLQSTLATTGSTSTGFVITEGLLEGLDTQGTTAGDPVWLGVGGNLIYGLANKPYAPAHLVFIGIVTKVSAGNGEIFVKVQNGFELKEIHDVDLVTTTPINGHILGFDGTLWVNKTIAGWLGFTPVTNARTISTTSPLSGGGDLSANRTLSISQANTTTNGYLSSTDWNTFNNKQNSLGYTAENSANKQNSLALDGTGIKYATIDSVNDLSIIDKYKRGLQYFTDFISNGSNTPNLINTGAGTGATTIKSTTTPAPNQTSNQIGLCQYQTGTTSTGWSGHVNDNQGALAFSFGGGSWVYETSIEVETLSTLTEQFRFIAGFCTQSSVINEVNAIIFTYDSGGTRNGTISSPNWQCVTSDNSVRTLTTTSVAVTTTWTKLRIEINAAATSVSFYINGTLVATHTTNIPTFANSRFLIVKQQIVKSAGTTNRSIFCDYLGFENRLTTIR